MGGRGDKAAAMFAAAVKVGGEDGRGRTMAHDLVEGKCISRVGQNQLFIGYSFCYPTRDNV